MGPVDGTGGAGAAAGDSAAARRKSGRRGTGAGAPRRLYLIHEGAMLAGVCTGLAAYLHVDVTIVRIVFLLLALITRGGFGLAYLVLAFVIPPADTSEERAAAHGQPFNAQELIDRAKKNYADFTDSHDWRRRWRREQRAWRRQWRAARWQSHWDVERRLALRRLRRRPAATARGWSAALMVPILSVCQRAVLLVLGVGDLLAGHHRAGARPAAAGRHAALGRHSDSGRGLPGDRLAAAFARRRRIALLLARRPAYYGSDRSAWDGVLSLGVRDPDRCGSRTSYMPEVREIIRTLPDVWEQLCTLRRFEDLRIEDLRI